jgi:hypothetical protein
MIFSSFGWYLEFIPSDVTIISPVEKWLTDELLWNSASFDFFENNFGLKIGVRGLQW